METEIESARRCIPIVKQVIEDKTQDAVVTIYPVNNERHFIFETSRRMKYYMIFKRNFFMSFGKVFGLKGIGESLNEEMVSFALEKGIHSFIFIYEDGKIYTIPTKEFSDYATSHATIRKTSSGEVTYSIPVGLLRRMK